MLSHCILLTCYENHARTSLSEAEGPSVSMCLLYIRLCSRLLTFPCKEQQSPMSRGKNIFEGNSENLLL